MGKIVRQNQRFMLKRSGNLAKIFRLVISGGRLFGSLEYLLARCSRHPNRQEAVNKRGVVVVRNWAKEYVKSNDVC